MKPTAPLRSNSNVIARAIKTILERSEARRWPQPKSHTLACACLAMCTAGFFECAIRTPPGGSLQLNALTKEWTDKAISYLMLTNAGGAVAVLSFMGASDTVRKMFRP
jgi:hypothetical protein